MSSLRFRISAVLKLCVAATMCVVQLGCGQATTDSSPLSSAQTKSISHPGARPPADFADGIATSEAMVEGQSHVFFRQEAMDGLGFVGGASRPSAVRATYELMPGEELWVIARGFDQAAPPAEEAPGCGALLAKLPDVEKEVPVPLKHTAVVGSIDGDIATVDVTQQFHNPCNSKIEAVSVLPLPDNAAVSEFLMTVLEYSLMSTFTAFVAVDSMSRTEGEFGTTVAVPVNVPEGVKYETTVEN